MTSSNQAHRAAYQRVDLDSGDDEQSTPTLKERFSRVCWFRCALIPAVLCFLLSTRYLTGKQGALRSGRNGEWNNIFEFFNTEQSCADGACGLTLEGGGFRALATYAAFTSAMMANTNRNLTQVFQPFASVSSNSGGSWFVASLAYSSVFADMVSAMAADTASAGRIFNESWVVPLLALKPAGTSDLSEGRQHAQTCVNMAKGFIRAAQDKDIKALMTQEWDEYLETLGAVRRGVVELDASVAMKIAKRKAKKGNFSGKKDAAKQEVNAAEVQLNAAWANLTKLVGQGNISPETQDSLNEMIRSEAPKATFLQDFLLMLDFLYAGGEDWVTMVAQVLQKTTGITLDVTLGSEPQEWAKGKRWYAATSIATPEKNGRLGQMNVWLAQNASNLNDYSQYSVSSADYKKCDYTLSNKDGKKMELYTPGRFAITWGDEAGVSAVSPVSFCASSNCFGFAVDYTSQSSSSGNATQYKSSSSLISESFNVAFEKSAGKLPVGYVAGSSSAAFGGVGLSRLTSFGASQCFDLAAWATSAPDGKAWTGAADLRSNLHSLPAAKAANRMANETLVSFLDGGYTDNTAIAWSVSAGQTRLLSLLNGPSNENFLQLFGAKIKGVGFQPLIQMTNRIFSMGQDQVKKIIKAAPTLALAPGLKYLRAVKYGYINTTTVLNDRFGITKGIPVTMNVINFNTVDVSDAVLSNYYVYSALVEEIVSTLTSAQNRDIMATW